MSYKWYHAEGSTLDSDNNVVRVEDVREATKTNGEAASRTMQITQLTNTQANNIMATTRKLAIGMMERWFDFLDIRYCDMALAEPTLEHLDIP